MAVATHGPQGHMRDAYDAMRSIIIEVSLIQASQSATPGPFILDENTDALEFCAGIGIVRGAHRLWRG